MYVWFREGGDDVPLGEASRQHFGRSIFLHRNILPYYVIIVNSLYSLFTCHIVQPFTTLISTSNLNLQDCVIFFFEKVRDSLARI